MTSLRSQVAAMPPILRFAVVGATIALLVGGVVGLVVGLSVYPPTAWFAVLEVGVPAGLLGAVLGAFVGLVVGTVGRRDHR